MSNYPRVLITGGPYGDMPATITTLRNLFQGWPQENLAQLCFSTQTPIGKAEIAESIEFLPRSSQPLDHCFRRILPTRNGANTEALTMESGASSGNGG